MTFRSLLICLSAVSATMAFQGPQGPRPVVPTMWTKLPSHSPARKSTALQAMEILDGPVALFDDFFRTQPFLSAFMMCSFKASAADFLAQTSESTDGEEEQDDTAPTYFPWQAKAEEEEEEDNHDDINVQRNFAFLLYGGLYQGMFLQFLYMVVYPFLYGDSMFRIPLCIGTDILCFGPFVTLPVAYIIRAIIDNATDQEQTALVSTEEAVVDGIDKYKNHVVTQNLLIKYWSVWAPAQTLNFVFVPEHLRVFFVAFVSFFWVFLLSIISNQQTATVADNATTTTTAAATSPLARRHNEPVRQAS